MALWTPADITTTLWLDASDTGSITKSGDDVTQWNDKSGNAYHYTQTAGSSAPHSGTRTLDTKNVVDFDGIDDCLSLSSGFQPGTNNTIAIGVFVSDTTTVSSEERIFSNTLSGGSSRFLIMHETFAGEKSTFVSSSSYNPVRITYQSGAHVLGGYRDGSTAGFAYDGATPTTGTGGDIGTLVSWDIGCKDGSSVYFDGAVAELIVITTTDSGTTLTDTRQKLEGYLAHKWGLEGNLPSGHPYKSAAPTVGTEITHTAGTFTMTSNTHTIDTGGAVEITHTAGTFNMDSNTHTITTPIGITHVAGTFNMDSNTHDVVGAQNINVAHTAGTFNMDSNTHEIVTDNNIEILHSAGVFNMDTTIHAIDIPVNITHVAGTFNMDSNTHSVDVSVNIEIEHVAGTFNMPTTTHNVSTSGTVIIEHTAGEFNMEAPTPRVVAINPVEITHSAGTFNMDSNTHYVGDLLITNVLFNRQAILFGGQNDTRVFMWGNDNKFIYSELADGLPSAEYFPESNLVRVSSDNFDITAMTKQYDRLIIHKENESHYSSYEIDATLGTIFSVFPLNDTVGNVAFGESRLIQNNPYTITEEGIQEFRGTNVRDERNAVNISERVQLGLDLLDLTTAVTYDFETNFEYFISVGNIVYVHNYRVDAWYKYELADSPTCFIEIDEELYFGTSTGSIMKFDADRLTDNGITISAVFETGFIDFGASWIQKFLTYAAFQTKPEGKSYVEIHWVTDQGSSLNGDPFILEYNLMDFGNVDFGDFSFNTNYSPRPFRKKLKAKKFAAIKMIGTNESDTQRMTMLNIAMPAQTGGQVK